MEEKTITQPFAESERTRFRNLLELANGSQFEGERQNALAAAKRLARRHGMTLDEAALLNAQPAASQTVGSERAQSTEPGRFHRTAVNLEDILAAKKKRNEALRRARERGLDGEQQSPANKAGNKNTLKVWRRKNQTRLNPEKHAAVLLRETSLGFSEIADITGLDIYLVVGIKLKLRNAA